MTAKNGPDGQTYRIGSPKLAYLALQRMNDVIGDLGSPARPGTLDLELTDPPTGAPLSEGAVERVVLRRADGSYVLALWQRAQSFSFLNFAPRDLFVAPRAVEVRLDGSVGDWDATTYVPAVAANPTGSSVGRRSRSRSTTTSRWSSSPRPPRCVDPSPRPRPCRRRHRRPRRLTGRASR